MAHHGSVRRGVIATLAAFEADAGLRAAVLACNGQRRQQRIEPYVAAYQISA